MDDTPEERALRAISSRRKRLAAQIKALRAEERAAILAAHRTGSKQVKLCGITGFTRDYVRRVTQSDGRPSPDARATGA